jgi:hypothetical protein
VVRTYGGDKINNDQWRTSKNVVKDVLDERKRRRGVGEHSKKMRKGCIGQGGNSTSLSWSKFTAPRLVETLTPRVRQRREDPQVAKAVAKY